MFPEPSAAPWMCPWFAHTQASSGGGHFFTKFGSRAGTKDKLGGADLKKIAPRPEGSTLRVFFDLLLFAATLNAKHTHIRFKTVGYSGRMLRLVLASGTTNTIPQPQKRVHVKI
jgi:hypothetical protein